VAGLPYSAYWEGNKLIFPNNEPEDPADTGVSQTLNDDTITKDAIADETADSNNLTASALGKRDPNPMTWLLDIRFQGQREHIGTLRKQRMNKLTKACLPTIGSPEYWGGKNQSPFPWLCRWYDEGCEPSADSTISCTTQATQSYRSMPRMRIWRSHPIGPRLGRTSGQASGR
jgi:hypothetical protein